MDESSSEESIAHLQRLLTQCGFVVVDDIGRFGPSTRSQLRAFQYGHGLSPTGICDALTFASLFEAHWKLGDRLLYLRRPMLRGDDVAQLQGKLSWLGFDPGTIDGVFGSTTHRALSDFQVNVGMAGDGICGPDTIAELERNFGRSPITVTGVRELMELGSKRRNPAGLTIAITSGLDLASVAEAVRSSLAKDGFHVLNFCHPDVSLLAEFSNTGHADVVLHLEVAEGGGSTVAYFQGFHYTSPVGQSIAKEIAIELHREEPGIDFEIVGSKHRMLQLTKAPCVTLTLDSDVLRKLAPHDASGGISTALTRWFADL